MDKLDHDTTVYFEPATCSQASMAPECTVILFFFTPTDAQCMHPFSILNIQAVTVKQFRRLIQAA